MEMLNITLIFTELLLNYCSPPHPTPLPLGEGAVVSELCEVYNGGRGYKLSNKKVTMPIFTPTPISQY